ncbi:hypothetical protein T11_10561 [Trichinella zimbabwensis]|uniref:Uncharacterized protein n=1 Tax=Trichinella zimbabwensis TaxID=268475 RepID=A0A0V1GMK0_9BILA|nr:hypothetical protein T11_5732 [Trichinella zimbabwensis]KRY99305.1 hypothetical protein T11_10561 [Trichinella zimbabwensis]
MNGIGNKKPENYNEPDRTLHESVSVEILAFARQFPLISASKSCRF